MCFLFSTLFRNLAVSYLIVDEAEEEMEMEIDPFLEAGIEIPTNLPQFKDKTVKDLKAADNLAPQTAASTPQMFRRKGSKPAWSERSGIRSRTTPKLHPRPAWCHNRVDIGT